MTASRQQPQSLMICAKSPWLPAIRRDHAIARLAAENGHRVVFVEQPADVRAVSRRGAATWLAGLRSVRHDGTEADHGISILSRSTILPPHKGKAAHAIDSALLHRLLRRCEPGQGATVVATAPWHWNAVARLDGVRRVFDCADDWSALMPGRHAWLQSLYARVAGEADAIIVDSPLLANVFEPADVAIVPNGTSTELLETAMSPANDLPVLGYAGTLSERFDVELVADVLERLPSWRMELVGECRYARFGTRPAPELQALLERFAGRLSWHGVVPRRDLSSNLDAARVLVLPHRRLGAVTGEAMKFYDYAARGRPIVSTDWASSLDEVGPPHLYIARTAEEWVQAVEAAIAEPPAHALSRRRWAEANRWSMRWQRWSAAAFG